MVKVTGRNYRVQLKPNIKGYGPEVLGVEGATQNLVITTDEYIMYFICGLFYGLKKLMSFLLASGGSLTPCQPHPIGES